MVSVEQSSKTLSFASYVLEFTRRVCLPSKVAEGTLAQNSNGEAGHCGCRVESHAAMHANMTPGVRLDEMSSSMMQSIRDALETKNIRPGPQNVKLLAWLCHIVTYDATNTVYGPRNPFQDAEMENAVWSVPVVL